MHKEFVVCLNTFKGGNQTYSTTVECLTDKVVKAFISPCFGLEIPSRQVAYWAD